MGIFKIDVNEMNWLENMDESEDLCAHGCATVQIGDEVLEYHATVSATALYLLKSIQEDHIMYEDIQMLPCCGFFYISDEDNEEVIILGCAHGIDWTVMHEGEYVRLITESGNEVKILLDEYREEVFRFADKVEAFYKASLPKKVPEDEFDKNGFIAFWNEWNRRRTTESCNQCVLQSTSGI